MQGMPCSGMQGMRAMPEFQGQRQKGASVALRRILAHLGRSRSKRQSSRHFSALSTRYCVQTGTLGEEQGIARKNDGLAISDPTRRTA
jgi:hypothetical protein